MAQIDTTNLDAGTDKIKLSRPAIKAMADWINGLMQYTSDVLSGAEKTAIRTVLGVVNKAGDLFTGVARAWYKGDNAVSTTSTFSYDPNTHGQIAQINVTNAITITMGAPTNVIEGANYKIMFKAGDTNARTLAWNSAYKMPSGVSPFTSLSVTTGGIDHISFIGGAGNTLIYDGHVADNR